MAENDSFEDFDIKTPKNVCKRRKPFTELSQNVKVSDKKEDSRSTSGIQMVCAATQCGPSARSYGKRSEHVTFRSLLLDFIFTKEAALDFCFRHKLLPSERLCPTCGNKMCLISDSKVSDGKRWYCRVRKGPLKHEHRLSLRTGTFFSQSNMTLEESLQFIYLWVHGSSQETIAHELGECRSSVSILIKI